MLGTLEDIHNEWQRTTENVGDDWNETVKNGDDLLIMLMIMRMMIFWKKIKLGMSMCGYGFLIMLMAEIRQAPVELGSVSHCLCCVCCTSFGFFLLGGSLHDQTVLPKTNRNFPATNYHLNSPSPETTPWGIYIYIYICYPPLKSLPFLWVSSVQTTERFLRWNTNSVKTIMFVRIIRFILFTLLVLKRSTLFRKGSQYWGFSCLIELWALPVKMQLFLLNKNKAHPLFNTTLPSIRLFLFNSALSFKTFLFKHFCFWCSPSFLTKLFLNSTLPL